MRFTPQFLDHIRQGFRLSEVISRRIDIKKKGREYGGLCPFHHEKTPSFTVNDEKGFYHCFGCQAHGDVIGFIKEFEGVSYIQAVEMLAKEAGIPLPQYTPKMREEQNQVERLQELMECAAGWFSQQLRRPPFGYALEYLKKRGLADETLAEFRLGFAPPERESLKRFLTGKGFTEGEIKAAGMLSQPDTGTAYDKFRDRVIFPIRDVSGRVIAFGGRLMTAKPDAPKYLNSPETILFSKGHVLYNADLARKATARNGQLLVAEGYMDVIALAQGGFPHAVAPLGTAVTEDHLGLAWQLADQPVFCLDGDSAGKQAMLRVMKLAIPHLKPDKTLQFCLLPQGEDPDSLIKARGPEGMQELLARPLGLAELLWMTHFPREALTSPEAKAAAEQDMRADIERIQHPALKKAYADDLRRRLFEAGRFSFKPDKAQDRTSGSGKHLLSRLPAQDNVLWQRQALEQQIMTLLVQFPHLLEEPDMEHVLSGLECCDAVLEMLRQEIITHASFSSELLSSNTLVHALNAPEARERAVTLLQAAQHDPLHRELTLLDDDARFAKARDTFAMALARLEHLAIQQELLTEGRKALADGDPASAERSLELIRNLQERQKYEYHLGKGEG